MYSLDGKCSPSGRPHASPEYHSWQQMKNRCLNPRGQDWKYYGGHGIRLTKRWHLYPNFLADMGRKPALDLTLERKNVNGPYCKSNCCWASRKTQARNRTYVKLSMRKAQAIRARYPACKQSDLAKEYEVSQVLISRIVRGVSWVAEIGGGA